jgi:hypothetical protein
VKPEHEMMLACTETMRDAQRFMEQLEVLVRGGLLGPPSTSLQKTELGRLIEILAKNRNALFDYVTEVEVLRGP